MDRIITPNKKCNLFYVQSWRQLIIKLIKKSFKTAGRIGYSSCCRFLQEKQRFDLLIHFRSGLIARKSLYTLFQSVYLYKI